MLARPLRLSDFSRRRNFTAITMMCVRQGRLSRFLYALEKRRPDLPILIGAKAEHAKLQ